MSKKKNKHIKRPVITEPSPTNTWLSLVVFIALGILLFYPPYVKGLFFQENMFLYHIITALVFILVWVQKISRKDYAFLETPLDWAILAYAAAYLLSLTGAVHPGEAFYGFLKALNFFMIYWVVTQVVKDYKAYENILKILLTSAVGVALVGILVAAGYFKYQGAFNGRTISSTLQYPNATAAYLAVLSLIAVTLWIRERRLIMKVVYGVAAYLLIVVVLAGVSKGAYLIFVIGIILLLLGMPGIYRLKSIYSLGVAGLSAMIVYKKFFAVVTGSKPGKGLLIVLAGFILVIAGQAIWEGLAALYRRKGAKPAVAAALIFLIAAGAAFSVAGSGKIISGNIAARLMQFKDPHNTSYASRQDLYRWGLAIAKDHPVVGTGAGGWNALYHQYQDYQMYSTQAHNNFLQVWVEAGTVGLLCYAAMWVMLLTALYKLYRRHRQTAAEAGESGRDAWILNWGTAAAAIAFGCHSAIDFDLSLAALSIVLWTLFALVNSAYKIELTPHPERLKVPARITIAAVMAIIMLFCGCSFNAAGHYAHRGAVALQGMAQSKNDAARAQDLTVAVSNLQAAIGLDSCNGDYYTDLAYCYSLAYEAQKQNQQGNAGDWYNKAQAAIKKADELKPYDLKIKNSLIRSVILLGDMNGTLREVDESIKTNPNDINGYDDAGRVLWANIESCLKNNQKSQARTYALKIVALDQKINQQRERIQVNARLWEGSRLEPTPELKLNRGRALYMLGKYSQAAAELAQVAAATDKTLPAWYAASLYQAGNTGKAGVIIASSPTNRSLYNQILALKPLK